MAQHLSSTGLARAFVPEDFSNPFIVWYSNNVELCQVIVHHHLSEQLVKQIQCLRRQEVHVVRIVSRVS